jgi:hypothetical protein
MSVEITIAIVLAFAAIVAALSLTVLPQYLDLTRARAGVIVWAGGTVTVLLFVSAIAFGLGGEWAKEHTGDLLGATGCFIGAVVCFGWGMWPPRVTVQITIASKIGVSVGETGRYFQTASRNLHYTTRTYFLCVSNLHSEDAITDVSIELISIEPPEYEGPWVIGKRFSLAAGATSYVPLVSYGEGPVAAQNYQEPRFTMGDSFMIVLAEGHQPKPSREHVHTFKFRVTAIGSAPQDYSCKIWVDRSDGRLRISDGIEPDPKPTLMPKTVKQLFETEFPALLKLTSALDATFADGTKLQVPMYVYHDYDSNADFVGFYVPHSPHLFDVALSLIAGHKDEYQKLRKEIQIETKGPGDLVTVKSEDLTFTGRVYLYHEDELSLRQLADLTDAYKAANLIVQFRGQSYAAGKWLQETAKP